MNPDRAAELIGRLNPKICKFSQGPGGVPEFTESDIAAAIGLLKLERDRLWVRVLYAGHDCYRSELERHLLMLVVDIAAPQRWHIDAPGTLMTCIRAAIHETTRTLVCSTCNGQRQVVLGADAGEMAGKSVICDDCRGTGYGRISDYLRAKQVGMDKKRWRTWRERYERILDQCRLIDGRSKSALAHRLDSA